MKRVSLGLVALGLSLGVTGWAKGGFVTLAPPPGSVSFSDPDTGTFLPAANGISNNGQIVGEYRDASGNQHGFLLSGGVYTPIDVPGPGAVAETSANGINVSGQIVGFFGAVVGGPFHGYSFSGGVYTQFDAPNSISTRGLFINDLGQIVGSFTDSQGRHGFVQSGGVYTTIEPPGARDTLAFGINNTGQIVGAFADAGNLVHGFLLNHGVYTTLDPPGSTFTEAQGINDAGLIVGFYDDASGNEHGFLFNNGVYATYDAPGARLGFLGTDIFSVNNAGQFVGVYTDTDGVNHAFVDAVPEPASLSLLGPGILGVLAYTRWRRRRAAA